MMLRISNGSRSIGVTRYELVTSPLVTERILPKLTFDRRRYEAVSIITQLRMYR